MTPLAPRPPSRSAALVAACRMLAAELPEPERLIEDPFACLVADAAAIEAARADEPLQRTIRLRTKYIDDAITDFAAHQGAGTAQVVLLGAGLDARAYRLAVDATYFEVDFPATLATKAKLLAHASNRAPRIEVPVDLAASDFVRPLVAAGFDRARPTIVVWEGVINYLSAREAEGVVEQLGRVTTAGGRLVADYVEMGWFKGSASERATAGLAEQLSSGGEPLKGGIRDVPGCLDRAGFDIVDDEAVEELGPRYGLTPVRRVYPARIFTAVRRAG